MASKIGNLSFGIVISRTCASNLKYNMTVRYTMHFARHSYATAEVASQHRNPYINADVPLAGIHSPRRNGFSFQLSTYLYIYLSICFDNVMIKHTRLSDKIEIDQKMSLDVHICVFLENYKKG